MNKKFFSFLIAIASFIPCVIALTACGGNNPPPPILTVGQAIG